MSCVGPAPPSRAERQRQTREALVYAAREVFARDGYHGAGLDTIARVAGYSKGAVYSNFDGKADLFLAVMDLNIEAAGTEGWDPFDNEFAREAYPAEVDDAEQAELVEAMRGLALATLEFIATAARDEDLTARMAERLSALFRLYEDIAARTDAADEWLPPRQVAMLLAGLDQGMALLKLGGIPSIDQRLLRTGLQWLLDPARAAAESAGEVWTEPETPDDGLHDREIQHRMARSARGGG